MAFDKTSSKDGLTYLASEIAISSSSGQLDKSALLNENTLTTELSNKVFRNELIRDRIFDYVFSRADRCYHRSILTCRLVDHTWLEYITHRLQNSESPRYTVNFNSRGVKNFVDTWAAFPNAGSRIPLFNLRFWESVEEPVEKTKVENLLKVLMQCGNGLYGLELQLFPKLLINGKETKSDPKKIVGIGPMDLPRLKKLRIIMPSLSNCDALSVLVLSQILSGCKQLLSLDLQRMYMWKGPLSGLLTDKKLLSGPAKELPNTLQNIIIHGNMSSELVETLILENSLPYLTNLKMEQLVGVNADVLCRILDRFSTQLKCFTFEGHEMSEEQNYKPNLSSTHVKFPVMFNLKKMSIGHFPYELEPGMEKSFPVLETLKFLNQTSVTMQKWTQNFVFNCVTVLIAETNACYFNYLNVTPNLSRQLPLAFPSVQTLRLTIGRLENSYFRNIFQKMTQLVELHIEHRCTREIIGAFTWDSVLLGVTPEYAKYLAASPRELWNSINLSHHRNPSHSIVNLSRLTTLRLTEGPDMRNNLLISDVSFQFAFLRMRNLTTLLLNGGFKASKEVAEEWVRQGRTIWGIRE